MPKENEVDLGRSQPLTLDWSHKKGCTPPPVRPSDVEKPAEAPKGKGKGK